MCVCFTSQLFIDAISALIASNAGFAKGKGKGGTITQADRNINIVLAEIADMFCLSSCISQSNDSAPQQQQRRRAAL
jgi:hypothetical protein